MLRAATGRPEPVVSVAGMLDGTTAWGEAPDEVNVIDRAGGIVAPVLLLHGTSDGLVSVEQARAMERALRTRGADIVAKYYEGIGHGLAQVPWVRRDMQATLTQFLCDRFGLRRARYQLRPRGRELVTGTRAVQLLSEVQLSDRALRKPPELSGGERQRLALARALANEPPIMLADEPTGTLDPVAVRQTLDLFARLRADHGVTVVMVTHDADVARAADCIVELEAGRFVEQPTHGTLASGARR